jgi:hypothetical protein
MVRVASASTPAVPAWHEGYLQMLPVIRFYAELAFRDYDAESREDLVTEVVANTLVAYVRLVLLGKTGIAYPAVLARYGIRQTLDGRHVGGHLNVNDISSSYAQKRRGIIVERLDRPSPDQPSWSEIVVEDRRAGPAEVAAARIDFAAWLDTLPRRDRGIAESLAVGNRTSEVAKQFEVCEGRISQLRRELAASWKKFVGDEPATPAA